MDKHSVELFSLKKRFKCEVRPTPSSMLNSRAQGAERSARLARSVCLSYHSPSPVSFLGWIGQASIMRSSKLPSLEWIAQLRTLLSQWSVGRVLRTKHAPGKYLSKVCRKKTCGNKHV